MRWALALLALVHSGLFALPWFDLVRQRTELKRLFRGDAPPNPAQLFIEVERLLPRLLEHVPADARVVLLNGRVQILPFQLHIEPRPARCLHRFDASFLDLPGDTHDGRLAHARYAFLERTGQRFTDERLAEELGRADYLITFFFEGLQVAGRGPRLEPIEVHAERGVGLYRIVRP
jgi:hypothetical protein